MNFCNQCGNPVELRLPPGDHLPRYVCTHCGTIHYQNPRIIAGCVPDHEGRILLCRRAIEPRLGFWTVPAGFMELRETIQQAAARESLEEARADVRIGSLLAVVHVMEAHQVHIFFRATLPRAEFDIAPESLEVGLFAEADIPWSHIAFPSIEFALQRYFSDRAAGLENHHFTTAERRPRM
ncbi:MAG TPA: NUDIX hydrolase [Steroidobacteraceae bacterium]|nr:NUDIX hydrolase [Steroidobacteraceae bacterium]